MRKGQHREQHRMYKIIDLPNKWKFEIGYGGTCFTLGFGWNKTYKMFHINLIFFTLSIYKEVIEDYLRAKW